MKDRRKSLIIAVFSMLLSAAGVLTVLLFWPFVKKSAASGLNIRIFSVWNLLGFIALSLLFYHLFCRIDQLTGRLKPYDTDTGEREYKFFRRSFAVTMACWGIWFWLYFPGAGMNDTLNCIMVSRNDNQTLLYQLFIYYGIHGLAALTHSMKAAYAILVFLQMIFMSLVISWTAEWLRGKRIKKELVWLFVAYYALMPVVADYSITLVKDTLFSVCMMAVVPLICDLVQSSGELIRNRKFYCAFSAWLIGISALRSNGKYIAIILVICLFFIRLRHNRYLLSVLAILLAVNTGIGIRGKKLIPGDTGFRESVGVPLAQIGAVLTVEGVMSEQDRDILKQLLPLETWKENARLSFVDLIKFDDDFDNQWLNDHKKEFAEAWFSVFRDNPQIYIKSYLCHTYGFWNISPASALLVVYNQSYFTEVNNNTGDDSLWAEFCAENDLQNRRIDHGTIAEVLHIVFKIAFAASMALGPGILFWICMWFVTELVIYRKYKICCVFLPAVLNWGTMMIAAPASLIYRYSFYLALSLPVLLLVMIMQTSHEMREEQTNDSTENIIDGKQGRAVQPRQWKDDLSK